MTSMPMLSHISPMRENNAIEHIVPQIAAQHELEFQSFKPLGGGDINEVYLVETSAGKYVVKLNDPQRFPGMFKAEKEGLEELASPGAIRIPTVLGIGEEAGTSYIIMEFIESTSAKKDLSGKFGRQLAALHRTTAKNFGFRSNNYIGSLPQYNDPCSTAAEFYITQRLEPQFKLAFEAGFDLGETSKLYKRCEELIPKEPPALVHGDLWGGNYLADSFGNPCLIDPAVAYAPREMDLGMMKLFGGFNEETFRAYDEHFPLEKDLEERIPLWQLYYLLVHLNIFGSGYRPQVTAILRQYS